MISKSYFTDGILLVRLFNTLFDSIGLDMKTLLSLLYCRRTLFRPMCAFLPSRYAKGVTPNRHLRSPLEHAKFKMLSCFISFHFFFNL